MSKHSHRGENIILIRRNNGEDFLPDTFENRERIAAMLDGKTYSDLQHKNRFEVIGASNKEAGRLRKKIRRAFGFRYDGEKD